MAEKMNQGYYLGRLYAILKSAGATEIGDEANVYDDTLDTPIKTFPLFFKRLHRQNPSESVTNEITEAMKNIGEIPNALTVAEQGSFSIGYYHQRHEMEK